MIGAYPVGSAPVGGTIAAGSAYTLAVSAATFSIIGQSVGLRVDRRITVQPASLTITGQSIGLLTADSQVIVTSGRMQFHTLLRALTA